MASILICKINLFEAIFVCASRFDDGNSSGFDELDAVDIVSHILLLENKLNLTQ